MTAFDTRSGLGRLLVVGFIASAAGCSETAGPRPSPAPLTLELPAIAEGHYVTCTVCAEPDVTVVVTFPVTILDRQGPGGTLASLATAVVNRTRGVEIARNIRPNADFAFPRVDLPPGGQLVVESAAVFSPPPPRDDVSVTVTAQLTDGRQASATIVLSVRAEE